MNKSMLVGAVGLALAGVAFAAQDGVASRSVRTSADAFTQARDAALGEAGSTQRAEVLAQLRAEIEKGNIDPRTVVFLLNEDLLPGSGSGAITRAGGAATEGVLGSNALFFDDYSVYDPADYSNAPNGLISLLGQTNPAGFTVTSADPEDGAATDAIMLNVAMDNPGGIPPSMQPEGGEPYACFCRRTGEEGGNTGFTLGMNENHQLLVPAPSETDPGLRSPLVSTDWYLLDAGTSQWWSPVSFTEGFVLDRMFFGGTNIGGVLGFGENANGILDNFVSLGTLAGNFTIGQFYAAQRDVNFPFPVGEWFRMMAVMATTPGGGIGYGLFIKTPESTNNPQGFMDPRLAAGDIIASDKDPNGWVNTYPGIVDDPNTTVHEGIGIAQTQFGELAPTNGPFNLGLLLAAISVSGTQFGDGLDPTNDPNFIPNDAFIDNYIAKGIEFITPNPLPDFITPYTDDFELYFPGPIRIQTDRIFDSISSNAVIVTFANNTPGGTQSLGQQNINNDNLYRVENRSALPTFPEPIFGTATDPMIFNVEVRIDGSTRTGRAVRLGDGAQTGNFAGTVLLGGTDPTSAFFAADGKVWIQQPNPNFDINADSDGSLVQANWIPPEQWVFPPNNLPFNTRFVLVPTGSSPDNSDGVDVPIGSLFTNIRFEVQPNPNQNPALLNDEGLMRIFINNVEVFPNGVDPGPGVIPWVAGGFSANTVQFWSSNNLNGQFDTIFIDDINFDGLPRVTPAGPAFTSPYADGFELYNRPETIEGQGSTPFLNPGSVPDQPTSDNARKLTVLDTNSNVPVNGTLVCRYTVDAAKLTSGVFNVGDVIALNFEALPLPFDTFNAQNSNCPGAAGASTDYVIRPGENMPRIETGEWTLMNQTPVAYDDTLGDNPNLSFSFTTSARWVVPGTNEIATVLDDPSGSGGSPAVLRLLTSVGVDGALFNPENPVFGALGGFLPETQSSAGSNAVLAWDLYIESVDVTNTPDDSLAPRSRMEVAITGATANSGRITTIMFGGPNVNNITNLQDAGVPIIPQNEISFTVPSGLPNPDTQFQSTNVSLTTLNQGGPGINGPLVNTWFRNIFSLSQDGTWTYAIDEDRDGPMAPVVVATGLAIDQGAVGTGGAIVDTSGIDFFASNLGFDIGSGGDPVPSAFRIHTIEGPSTSNWDAIAPTNADPKDDYCFYETNTTEFELTGSEAQIARFDTSDQPDGVFIGPANFSANNDVVAVINRAVDPGTNTVSGPLLFDPCPDNVSSTINQFELTDGTSANVGLQYRGRWNILGGVGQSGVNNPIPAGGITRPDGPSQATPVSYNDPLAEPPGFPATIASRDIIIARWGSDDADPNMGVDPIPDIFPRSRWFIDNLNLGGAAPCASLVFPNDSVDGADLAFLLTNWGPNPGSPADTNGDDVVNGIDLAFLLTNWGPCQ